ncbi:aminotransferase class I/II-fold pyridoxal phosphate-dependent enzyme [Gloeocapsopsis crepidinum LEGE 06123]|uniref:Aminotransferase class I/II-fold pyridoxal phosphate-dependent enzyme n=1 Tax=Gloeocapsopsis crepidinum LEGE 06123 TaxID=588587 RepID=A0ABR9UWN1_9CHRO|nr:aminotransferase class I/II-fold pyridoxal phosphate-dependent enzyme [Gloeocapsopsis crepidinum]MBE9192709.1 aminotransferase class I/II-fold pyridoxal phosphate-dependent enzyme [Gloeocapsopsis crepidinum LEGE 06123]
MSFPDQHQTNLPILNALRECTNKNHAAFYTPGHKRGQGISSQLADAFDSSVFKFDLPELPELDNLFVPQGVIQQAQELAADIFGAEQTWFLVNGSTCGVEAAILATCGVGDKIILPRNVHSSCIAGLILSGAIPVFVNPEYDSKLDIAHSITPESVAIALQQHPDAKAVMIVYPTYYGACGDIGAIASLTHKHNIPLLVDEAHGGHFAFHPDLPISALAAGADLTVQSTHKVLGAMTQASMLHIQGSRIDRDRITKALQLLQSTSPSYLLLASLDAARQQMALQGKQLMSQTLQLAKEARTQIHQIPGLSVLECESTPGFDNLDPTRLTVTVSDLGLTGFEADEILHEQLGVTAELPSLQHLTFIISLGNTQEDIEKLVQAFILVSKQHQKEHLTYKKPLWDNSLCSMDYSVQISPRQAYFTATESVPITQASDRICAELVCPYPPGIPVLMPGELITSQALDYLQQIQAQGGFISGCADQTLNTLRVVRSDLAPSLSE